MDKNPVKLLPAFKDYLWGGTKLKTDYNKKSDLNIVAESWELSNHKDGQSTICSGEYSELTFGEYLDKIGKELLGRKAASFDFFPILIKFIDAHKDLSVQVHPSDEYALVNEGEYGKTEMWYVLDCEPGASLYYGLNTTITKDELKKRIEDNTLLEILNKVDVKKGDVFFIEAGTIHAIGAGIVICEIQQNSNTTYRVYDYNRRDKNGNTRQLHIDKAIEVSDLCPAPPVKSVGESDDMMLASCKYFTVRALNISGSKAMDITDECFNSVIVTDGRGKLCMNGEEIMLQKGDSIFIPAQNGEYILEGSMKIILSYV